MRARREDTASPAKRGAAEVLVVEEPRGAEVLLVDESRDAEVLLDEPKAASAEVLEAEPEPHPEEELWPAKHEKVAVGVEDLLHAARLGEKGISEGLNW